MMTPHRQAGAMRARAMLLLLLALCAPMAVLAPAVATAAASDKPGAHAVASAHPLATQAGLEVLAAGGNAFDAAVAVSAAIAVVEPTGSGIGGGGLWLLHRQRDGMQTFVDGRETAPGKASATMYLGADGKAVDKRSRDGALAAAIPGEPAALDHIARTYGRLPLARSLAPAIRYARDGFACDAKLAEAFAQHWRRLSPAAQATFAVAGGPPPTGALLRQPDLATTIERLATKGRDGFYQGDTAQRLLAGVQQDGGIWAADDLRGYRVIERAPITLRFGDYRIVTAPPPSAGGVTIGEVLNQLGLLGFNGQGITATHQLIEAMRRAFRDRAAYLGDPDFVPVPTASLLSADYARGLVASINPARATPSASLPPAPAFPEGTHTTHLSVLDADGNRVAATLSINLPFGSGYMPAGTGVFLNDEMDDFAASETASNAYGLIGSKANLVAPNKRPLSTMTPTFVEGPRGLLVLGTPGGSRIVTMVLLGLLDWMQGGDVAHVVALPRFHHQYLPDVVEYEANAFSAEQREALAAMGHVLKPVNRAYGNLQAVSWNPRTGVVDAASDPRGVGEARVVRPAR
jgi:gamma-glutamyltranspeptidase/glutathione hydrolase